MKTLLYRLLVLTLLLGSVYTPDFSAAYAATPQTAAQKQKAAAQAKKKKEAEKKKAQKQKEQAKKKKAQQKAAEEKQEAREKQQAQAAKALAEKQEAEEAQKQAWLKQQAELANPKTEVISLFNLSAKVGYAGIMDNMATNYANVNRPSELDNDYMYHSLKGGPGAGFAFTYELQYSAFRFETGIDFTYLNSTSAYEFNLMRRLTSPYPGNYYYITDNLRETRNVGHIGVPILFGAQFSRYYFLVGAKVGYGLFSTYKQKGQYDIVVEDDALLEPYGLGIHDVPTTAADDHKFSLKQPSVSLCAEVGIDLDEWMQAQPDKKKKKQVKPGQRLPFGREYIHYKLGVFAEYGVLNTNNPSGTLPLTFSSTDPMPLATNSMLSLKDTKVNNLFVGVRFAVQFEVPGKKLRPVPAPPSATQVEIYDRESMQLMSTATLKITNNANNRVVMKPKTVSQGNIKQRTNVGEYTALATAAKYYPAQVVYSVDSPGIVVPVKIYMQRRPIFRLTVADKETGASLATNVQIVKRNNKELAHSLATDSIGTASQVMLEDTIQYAIHIDQIGYESLDTLIANIGDSMHLVLTPIKKGEVFIMKNLFFATNKTRILSSSEESLEALFGYLQRNPEVRIRIIGHTDNVGKDEANQKLSDGRANAVRKDLIDRGIDETRLEAEGRGEKQPIDTNDTDEGRQNNRRVEIEIL